jgi:hypothetical protein
LKKERWKIEEIAGSNPATQTNTERRVKMTKERKSLKALNLQKGDVVENRHGEVETVKRIDRGLCWFKECAPRPLWSKGWRVVNRNGE